MKNNVNKLKIEWIDALRKLCEKNQKIIDKFKKSPLINLNIDSMSSILVKHLCDLKSEKSISVTDIYDRFITFFKYIILFDVPFDTFSFTAFDWYNELLIPNGAILGSEKSKNRFAAFTNRFSSAGLPLISDDTCKQLKRKIDTVCNALSVLINDINEHIDKLVTQMKDIQDHILSIHTIFQTFDNHPNKIEQVIEISNHLHAALNKFNDKIWLAHVNFHAGMISTKLEEVISAQELLPKEIGDHLPYDKLTAKPTLMVHSARLHRISTRLKDTAEGVNDFVRGNHVSQNNVKIKW